MPTPVQICNSALIRLGAKTITALTDATKEGDLCEEQYPKLRNWLLRSHPWRFNSAVQELGSGQRATSDLDPYWEYKFTVPTSAPIARILSITDLDDHRIEYEIVGGLIHCNETDIRIRYVPRYTATAAESGSYDYPEDFAEALAALLAANLAMSLTQNSSLYDRLMQEYREAVSIAKHNGAIELPPQDSAGGDWLDAREGLHRWADPDHRDTVVP